MTRLATILGMCMLMSARGTFASEAPELVVLENQVLRLEIRTTPAPYVDQLVHRASGRALIAGAARQSLFSIMLANETGGEQTIDSARAGESSVSWEKSGGVSKVTITYGKFPRSDLAAVVTVVSDEKSALTQWSLQVKSAEHQRIGAIRFPQLLGVPTIGEGRDDCLVLPALPGTLIENPAETWGEGTSATLSYPGNLSAQFLAYQDPEAGIYLATMDSAGYPMSLTVFKQAEGFRLWHAFVPVPTASDVAHSGSDQETLWESPYPVAIGVTQGTWHESADQYKQWAVQQPWCAKRLTQREDIPAWWKNGPVVHVLEVRTYDQAHDCNGSYYPQLLQHLRALRDKIDGPIVPMLAGWENHRRWTAGDYFPIFDAENAQRVIGELNAEGFRPFVFLSGLFSTYRNEGRDGEDIPRAEEFVPSYVVDSHSGKPRTYELNESNAAGEWKRHSYEFCVGAAQTTEFFCEVVDRLHGLGIDVVQMDQTTSGAGGACYSNAHGHLPGVGLYQSQEFWKLLAALRQRGKTHSADSVLFHEEPHEQLIPYLDGFHVREYYEKRWYRGYPGAVGIPLFAYLYHEYAIGYGGDSASLSERNDRWLVRSHAMNLVTGRTPGAAIWSSTASASAAHPDQIAVIRNHCQLLKTRARTI